jgi:hypothetical protein
MTESNHNWPSIGQKLFVENPDRWMNAIFHSYTKEGYSAPEAFKDAADRLVDSIDPGSTEQDHLAVPILFLYRHYLELDLKHVIRSARIALRLKEEDLFDHRLLELWKTCRSLLEQIQPNDPSRSFDAVEALIAELFNLDPFATAFRYSHDRKGNLSLNRLDAVDLRHFRQTIDGVYRFLFGCDCVVDEYSSHRSDMEQHYGELP